MMQYDVKSAHASSTGLLVTQSPVRLKSITVTSGSASPRNVAICDPTVQKSGTYARVDPSSTITVTIVNHGFVTGQRVFLDFTSGIARDGTYAVTVTGDDTFTCVDPLVTTNASGNVTAYSSIALEIDTFNTVGLPVLIPGEGIYLPNGLFVGCGANVTATVFYG
jgi:hypothetical protein